MVWYDEEECDPPDDAEGFLQSELEDLRAFAESEAYLEGSDNPAQDEIQLMGFRKEVIRYHAEYRPAAHADYVFERIDV